MSRTNHLKAWTFQKVLLSYLTLMTVFATGICNEVSAQDSAESKLVSAIKRDPFWPVGYVPESVRAAQEESKSKPEKKPANKKGWNDAMKKVVINGVSSADNDFYAVINGEIKKVGDTISVNYEGTVYTWAVDGIKPPSSVRLRRVSAL